MGRTESKGNAEGLGFRSASAKESETPLPRMAGTMKMGTAPTIQSYGSHFAKPSEPCHSGCECSFTEASVLGAERGYHVQKTPHGLLVMGTTQSMGITRAGRRASAVHFGPHKNETPEAWGNATRVPNHDD